MNAVRLLRTMHSDTKVRLKTILGVEDAAEAQQLWQALKPLLETHEQLEDEFLYSPLSQEMGPGTGLGDWLFRHNTEVAVVKRMVAQVDKLSAGTPEWQLAVGQVTAVLTKHVTDEEGQIFGRIEQAWDAQRLDAIGAQMEKRLGAGTRTSAPVARAGRSKRK